MIYSIKEDLLRFILRIRVVEKQEERVTFVNQGEEAERKPVRVGKKVGRNEACPCGSGKKYKNCCGKQA